VISRAATVFDRNLVVTAGAGTGKTALLVERALNLVASTGLRIDALAAITFTEKAAAELRERLATGLDALRDLARRDAAVLPEAERRTEALRSWAWLKEAARVPASEVEARALAALKGLDAATVTTIHAFCAEILRRYPREAGVDPSFQIDEGTALDALFDDEWASFLDDEVGPSSPRENLWERTLLVPGALGFVRDLGRAMASFSLPSEAADPAAARAEAARAALFGAEAAAIRGDTEALLSRATGMNPNMKDFLRASAELLDAFIESGIEAMRAVASPMPLDVYLARDPAAGAKMTESARQEAEALKKRAKRLVTLLSKVDEETVRDLAETAAPLAARVRERLLASSLATYDALLRLARDLLAREAPVRRALAARYRALLVDEFQDTDPLQYEILLFIAEEEGPAAADAFEARLRPGSLFIVGDPKQSIYRFRGADIEAYQRAVRRILDCGGEAVSLATSYRSPKGILDPVNAIFAAWIGPKRPGDEAYEPVYEAIAPARADASPEPRVEIWSVPAGGNAAARRMAEAGVIASWIAGNAGATAATGVPLQFRQIAILFRALTIAPLYAQALRRADVPFVVEGGRDFYERREVADLVAFLRAAANPNDGASVLAVLRSPLGAVPDAELARFAAVGGRLDRAAVVDARFPAVRRAFDLLAGFRKKMVRRPPDDSIRAVLDETPLALLHAAAFDGAQRVSNLKKIVARAEDLSRRGLSLEETLRHIEDEQGGGRTEGESPLADETVNAVRILSIHKAKGLEYPVVVIPDVGRRSMAGDHGGDTAAAWLGRGRDGRLAARLRGGAMNLAWAALSERAARHDAAEEKRVFYVACTRARERLILVNSEAGGKSVPWRNALAAVGYVTEGSFPDPGILAAAEAPVRHVILDPAAPLPVASVEAIEPIWERAAREFLSRSEAALVGAGPLLRRPTGEREERESDDDSRREVPEGPGGPPGRAKRADAGRDAPRLAGSAIHVALEHWDFRDAARFREHARAAARELAARAAEGASGEDRKRLREETLAETDRIAGLFLASPLPARLAAVEILAREAPFLYRGAGGEIWRGYVDLVYRDADGTVVVADYKTGAAEGDEETAREVERYRGQLGLYREALGAALAGGVAPVRAEILFVRSGAVRAID